MVTFTGNAADNLYLSAVTDTDTGTSVLQYSTATNQAASSNLGASGQTLTIVAGDTIDVNLSGANSTLFIESSLSAVLQSTGVTVNYTATSSDEQLVVQVQADPNATNAQTITLTGKTTGSVKDQENAATATLVSFSGIAMPVSFTVSTPGPADQI